MKYRVGQIVKAKIGKIFKPKANEFLFEFEDNWVLGQVQDIKIRDEKAYYCVDGHWLTEAEISDDLMTGEE